MLHGWNYAAIRNYAAVYSKIKASPLYENQKGYFLVEFYN